MGKGKAMEDFLTSFFITPFTGLAEGIATATSPLDVIDAVDGFVWGPIMILLLLGTHIFMTIRTGFIQRKIGTGGLGGALGCGFGRAFLPMENMIVPAFP